jgi:hypothetical protein
MKGMGMVHGGGEAIYAHIPHGTFDRLVPRYTETVVGRDRR